MFTVRFPRTTLAQTPVQCLTYDTKFNLSEFYVSVLLFHETEFVSSPVIPLAFLIHERWFTETHGNFLRHMARLCPEVNKAANVIFVTDDEQAIYVKLWQTTFRQKNFPVLES